MRSDRIALYPGNPAGAIKAYRIGAFVKGGENFDVIRPGYDIQGNKKPQWTQVVHGGIPIFENKMAAELSAILDRFDKIWDQTIGLDPTLLPRALAMTKAARAKAFGDGKTSTGAAPSVTRDGRTEGERYLR